jgi:uncharacterized peroxidase-related enzyme
MNRRLTFSEAHNLVRILGKSPVLTEAFARAELTPQEREQIALAVAEINDCAYCVAAHAAAARNAGLTQADIELARKAKASDPKAEAMLRFTQLVTLQRGDIIPEDLRAVIRAGFSEGEVMEIIANIALNIFTNYLNVVFRTEVECPAPTQPLHVQASPKRLQAEDRCFICGKSACDSWFGRVWHKGKRIVMCSPSCAMRCFDALYPPRNQARRRNWP